MSKMGELHIEQNDDMQECMMAQEEQAYCQAVSDVAGFIASGAISIEQFKIDLREAMK